MTQEERVWLVERDYSDKGLVTLVYATTDGAAHVRMQRSATMLQREPVTAALDVSSNRLTAVADSADRERYAGEAERMATRHDPDDTV